MTPELAFLSRALLVSCAGLGCLYFLVLGICGLVLMVRARSRHLRTAASAAARPKLQQAVIDYLAGSPDTAILRQHLLKQREEVGDALMAFQAAVGGSARDRLCGLALEFSLVHDWCGDTHSREVPRRRRAYMRLAFASTHEPVRRVIGDTMLQGLRDSDSEVRLAAARSVLPSATDEDIADIYEIALGNNLLTRVVLTEDLRRHALTLSAGPVRKALRSENLPRVRAAMQMLVAWERATPLEDIREFLDHRDRGIRVLAFRLVSLLPANFDTRLALIRGLNDSDVEIRTLAVISAGRLKMTETIPELARCMRDGDMALARHAAESIGGMPNGDATLVELAAGNEPQTAAAAAEVLTRLRSKS
jgi:hypothetical protein